jgi:oligopeptide transport system substrate-binding protein
MKQKYILFNVVMAAMLAFLPSCKQSEGKSEKKKYSCKPSAKQMIKINIVSEPHHLDPRRARSLNDINLSKMFMEGLTRLKNNDEATLAAAKTVSVSDDGLYYTFTIRDSKWSNGDKVTSYDFAYSWKKVLSPDFQSDYASQMFVVKNGKDIKHGELPASLLGVSCPNESTLVVQLEHPVPYFLKLVAHPVFYPVNPKTDKKSQNWAFNMDTYVGNGPFVMKAWTHHDKIVAVKNPYYWDTENVKLEQIEMLMVSEDTGLRMFENNEFQWEGSPFSAIPTDAIESLKKRHELNSLPMLGTKWIHTNTEKGPLSSANVRKAFALAINRQEIVDYVTQGNQLPATSIVPAALGLQETPYFKDADYKGSLDALEIGLKELGMTKEDLNDIKLIYGASDVSHKLAQVLQQQWFETLGVLVKLEAVEPKAFFDKVSNHNFDLAIGSWMADFADPITFLDIFVSKKSGINATNWEDANYAKSIESSFICKDTKQRTKILQHAEKMIMDAMPVIPIYNYTMLYVKDHRVKNVELSNAGQIDFKWAYVDNI